MRPSLEDTVLFVVRLKVFIHATGVGHLFAIDLWQELRVLDSLLLVEQDVSRVGVDLLGLHFLVRETWSVKVLDNHKWSTLKHDESNLHTSEGKAHTQTWKGGHIPVTWDTTKDPQLV